MPKRDRFTATVKAWAHKVTDETLPDLAVMAATEAYSRVKQRTPIDTGFARSSWWMSLQDKGTPGQVVTECRLGDVIRVGNGVEYIVALEYGHSLQAPQGMVRVTLAEWETIVDRQAKTLAR